MALNFVRKYVPHQNAPWNVGRNGNAIRKRRQTRSRSMVEYEDRNSCPPPSDYCYKNSPTNFWRRHSRDTIRRADSKMSLSDLFISDQGENIALHTKRGIEFLDRYSNFLTERYKVENDYAKQMKLLASKYMPKRRDDEEYQFTHRLAFFGMLNELNDMANQHERIAEQFRDEIVVEIGQLVRKLREQRKENLEEAVRLQNQLSSSIDSMRRTMKEYNRAYKESEAAKMKYDRAELDMNLSRAEVEKAKNNAIAKLQQAEDAKNSYALQLQKTNEFQHDYYTRLLPAVFERLRELDETRISAISCMMARCANIERDVLPIIEKCLQGMLEHSSRVDSQTDTAGVVQRYKSGYCVPEDYPFDDLSAEGSTSGVNSTGADSTYNNGANSENGHGNAGQICLSPAVGGGRKLPQRKPSAAGSIVSRVQAAKRGKLANLFKPKIVDETFKDDYSDLPPQQQCKRLTQRIEMIRRQIETKIAQRDGLTRMQSVYRESPQLGDVDQVEMEFQKCGHELSNLQRELDKFQGYLKEAKCRLNTPINMANGSGSDSTASSSFSSFTATPVSTPRAPPPDRPPPPVTAQPAVPPDPHEDSLEGSGSEYSMGGCPPKEESKAKSRTPIPSFAAGTRNDVHSGTNRGGTHAKIPAMLSVSPESGLGSATGSSSSGVALAVAEEYDDWAHSDEDNSADVYQNRMVFRQHDKEPTVLGTCRAVYDFSGNGEGMLPMKEGEEMLLLERDTGDGWTKIRKEKAMEEGFVPTLYLDCKWYPEE